MIVVCSACQARFKVADEKVGPRGAKVRCSKCQTVFVVHLDLGVVPGDASPAPSTAPAAELPARRALDLDLEPAPRPGVRPVVAADPFSQGPVSHAAADPFAPSTAAPFDPFGSAPFPSAGPGARDPFAAADPFASPPAGGGGIGSIDPFVATVSSAGRANPAMTDLSDLLGGGGEPSPSGVLETGFDFVEPDLTLAERTAARPVSSAPMTGFGDFAGEDPFSEPGGGFEPGGFNGFGEVHESFDAPAPAAPTAPASAPAPAHAAPVLDAVADSQAAVGTRRRSSQLRAFAVNAVSLLALLAVALAFLAYWRGVRPGLQLLTGPAAVLSGAGGAPFSAVQVRSGIYDRSDAPPVLFVSGAAVSHASAAVPGLRVRVEVVRKGAVLARGEASAGAVPTPEELYASRDAAGLAAAVARRVRTKLADVKPGESVPFMVAISDYPGDVAGARLRVTVEPVDARAGGAR
ncbi:MAG: zinc-ribbon domain-containing protein [Anaeromyxobacteraceae bacterium]